MQHTSQVMIGNISRNSNTLHSENSWNKENDIAFGEIHSNFSQLTMEISDDKFYMWLAFTGNMEVETMNDMARKKS